MLILLYIVSGAQWIWEKELSFHCNWLKLQWAKMKAQFSKLLILQWYKQESNTGESTSSPVSLLLWSCIPVECQVDQHKHGSYFSAKVVQTKDSRSFMNSEVWGTGKTKTKGSSEKVLNTESEWVKVSLMFPSPPLIRGLKERYLERILAKSLR